jgi:hypothetical protein
VPEDGWVTPPQQISKASGQMGGAEEGTIICKTGFFGRGQFNSDDISRLVIAMLALQE